MCLATLEEGVMHAIIVKQIEEGFGHRHMKGLGRRGRVDADKPWATGSHGVVIIMRDCVLANEAAGDDLIAQ